MFEKFASVILGILLGVFIFAMSQEDECCEDAEAPHVEHIAEIVVAETTEIKDAETEANTQPEATPENPEPTFRNLGKYKITAYCACKKCCGKTNGITASGKKAKANHTIAAPSNFAFGTKLKINGKIYTVEDRGGAIKGNRIDIYFDTHEEALKFGVKYYDVYIQE